MGDVVGNIVDNAVGSVVGCNDRQVRFAFHLDERKKGKEYFCVLTVEEYENGLITLISEEGSGVEFGTAPYAAEAFLNSTTCVGTAKRILKKGKKDTVKVARIDFKKGEDIIKSILVPKRPETNLAIVKKA